MMPGEVWPRIRSTDAVVPPPNARLKIPMFSGLRRVYSSPTVLLRALGLQIEDPPPQQVQIWKLAEPFVAPSRAEPVIVKAQAKPNRAELFIMEPDNLLNRAGSLSHYVNRDTDLCYVIVYWDPGSCFVCVVLRAVWRFSGGWRVESLCPPSRIVVNRLVFLVAISPSHRKTYVLRGLSVELMVELVSVLHI